MGFKAPDGKEFETRVEWRDYMMNNFYSFKNKKDDHSLVKKSGEVDGQVFDLADSENCTMLVMDNCEQVQMDKLVNCKVLIGACASSIFIRDCTDCTFYTSCKQLRVRDCKNCTFYSHCMSELHIELSTGLKFGHLNSGYPGQRDHLLNARLDPTKNFWYDVYDHNDPDKKQLNWNLLKPAEYAAPFFPAGPADICVECKQGKAGSAQLSGQIGDSFKLDQMIADRARSSPPKPVKSKVLVPIETCLLVANASARNIDLMAWLAEGQEKKENVPMEYFRGKMHSLALMIGVEADEDSKAEIELGTNSDAMEKVEQACPGTTPSSVSVPTFLAQCEEVLESYLADPSNQGPTEEPIGLVEEEPIGLLEEEDIAVEQEGAGTSPPGSPKEALLPSSPYDEEVEFDLEEEEDADTALIRNTTGARPSSVKGERYSNATEVDMPRPKVASRPRPKTAPVVSRPPVRPTPVPLEPQSAELQAMVEDELRGAVRRTDVYHCLQVHLGFIADNYTMNSIRGQSVKSIPRQWLSIADLQKAMSGARIRLGEVQIYALIKIVKAFAKEVREVESAAAEAAMSSSKGATKPLHRQPVVLNRRLNANWLRRYLVTLRLNKCTKPWQQWLGEKVASSREVQGAKPKMFMRALAGREHTLTKDDVNRKLENFEIVPKATMDAEIGARVDSWLADTDGRREFKHKMNVAVRKYEKENLTMSFTRLPIASQKQIKQQLKTGLVDEKTAALQESERKSAAITKDLYWKFDGDCRRNHYRNASTFGEWLKQHRENADKNFQRFKENMIARQKLVAERNKSRNAVASLKTVETKLMNFAAGLSTQRGIELRKSLVALRRSAEKAGHAQGALVTKEDFDKHLENVLAPCLKQLPDDIKELAMDPLRKSREGTGDIPPSPDGTGARSEIFFNSHGEAAKQAVMTDKENNKEMQEFFERWLQGKNAEKAAKRAADIKAAEEKKKEERAKRARAKKAYRQWVKLRKKDQYRSTVDGKLRDIPDANKVRHGTRWNKDVEMDGYYATQEQNFL